MSQTVNETLLVAVNHTFFCLHAGNASEHVVKAQPETKAMMELILDRGYTLSVALDGGALVATYPYDRPVQPGNATLLLFGDT